MKLKRCKKCGKEKPATRDYFCRNAKAADGLTGACAQCIREYQSAYRSKNR